MIEGQKNNRVLTIRKICKINNFKVPEELIQYQDMPVPRIHTADRNLAMGSVYFQDPIEGVRPDEMDLSKPLMIVSNVDIDRYTNGETSVIIAENPNRAAADVCRYINEINNYTKRIGVTGSVGKTTTKEMICSVLGKNFNYITNVRNSNNRAFTCTNIQRVQKEHEYYIQEIGACLHGYVDSVAYMLNPNACVITNIGNQHIDKYYDKNDLIADKLSIARNMTEDGVAFLNGDDETLKNAELECKTITFGMHNKDVDYYCTSWEQKGLYLNVDFVDNIRNDNVHVEVEIPGEHNVYNVLAAYAVAMWSGMEKEQAIEGISDYKASGTRQVIKRYGDGYLYLDCFNNTEKSLRTSLKTLNDIDVDAKNRVAVVGDFSHLGDLTEGEFRAIGRELEELQNINMVVCFGFDVRYLYDEIKGNERIKSFYTSDRTELNQILEQNVPKNSIILFKSVITSDKEVPSTVDKMFGTTVFINTLHYLNKYGKKIKNDDFIYFVYEQDRQIASLNYYRLKEEEVVIPNEVEGVPVTHINRNSFKKKGLKKITIGKNVIGIDENAFMDCSKLEKIEFNEKIKLIEDRAFKNCTMLKELRFPQSIQHIGEEAFAGCAGLKKVYLPKKIGYVAENAFESYVEIEYYNTGFFLKLKSIFSK